MHGEKHDNGKTMYHLLPYEALEQVAKVMMFGVKKYGINNWRQGMKHSRLWNAAQRHLISTRNGELHDEETGLLHTAHAACCVLFLLCYQLLDIGENDLDFKYREPE